MQYGEPEISLPRAIPSDSDCPTLDNVPLYTVNASDTYLGSSFSSGDLNGDGISDLVIGAPGWSDHIHGVQCGAVFILYGNSTQVMTPATVNQLEQPWRVGHHGHDRFGSATAVLDLNLDGLNDLVVASPTTSADSLSYRGTLSIFLGHLNGISASPSLTITSALNFTNLGHQLITGDVNGDGSPDLLVGAPFAAHGGGQVQQEGRVYLLLADASTYQSGVDRTVEDAATWVLNGHESNEQFGTHMVLTEGARNELLLLIGAPTWKPHLDSEAEKGALYMYDVEQLMKGSAQEDAELLTLHGAALWDQAGYSFSVGPFMDTPRALGLSCPARKPGGNEEQFGEIYFFDLDSLSGVLTIEEAENLALLRGDYKFARFGHVTLYDEDSNVWWVTQPRRDFGVEGNPEAGAVFAWSE